jgi:hypothetical protein
LLEPELLELERELELELDLELEPDCWLSDPDSLDLLFRVLCFLPLPEVGVAGVAEALPCPAGPWPLPPGGRRPPAGSALSEPVPGY